jgi:hypothetical protein
MEGIELLRALEFLGNVVGENSNTFRVVIPFRINREKGLLQPETRGIEKLKILMLQNCCRPNLLFTSAVSSFKNNQSSESPDFPRFLSASVAILITLSGDEDINVRSVVQECLNKVILVILIFF